MVIFTLNNKLQIEVIHPCTFYYFKTWPKSFLDLSLSRTIGRWTSKLLNPNQLVVYKQDAAEFSGIESGTEYGQNLYGATLPHFLNRLRSNCCSASLLLPGRTFQLRLPRSSCRAWRRLRRWAWSAAAGSCPSSSRSQSSTRRSQTEQLCRRPKSFRNKFRPLSLVEVFLWNISRVR